MMPAFKNLSGQLFGRLRVANQESPSPSGLTRWVCECTCGREIVVVGTSLTRGETKSCGCLRREVTHELRLRHGNTVGRKTSREYNSWRGMMDRCINATHKSYADYGGRGITVCERWFDFSNFLLDMGKSPPGTSIDRFPETSGNYEPGNCRWADKIGQARNKRNTVYIWMDGRILPLTEAAEILGMTRSRLDMKLEPIGATT